MIAEDEAQVFVVPLAVADEVYRRNNDLLSADEIARADRFVTDELRRRFVVCRGTLRQLLGLALQRDPAHIRFGYEALGKPYVEQESVTAVHFNVTHSGDWALIALANWPVGVDLEIPSTRVRYASIASQLLSRDEQAAWDAIPAPDREEALVRLWVSKESILKAMGLGIAEGLRQITFPIPLPTHTAFEPRHIDPSLMLQLEEGANCRRNAWIDPGSWQLRFLKAMEGAFSVLCTPHEIQKVSLKSIDPLAQC